MCLGDGESHQILGHSTLTSRCFWINLPFGGVAAAAVLFLLPARPPEKREGFPAGWRGLLKMDWIGTVLIFCLVTCLLLALQWGGNEYAWNSGSHTVGADQC